MQTQSIQKEFDNNSNLPSFYKAIDKDATIKAAKDMMQAFQAKWRQKKKTGGVNANTFDLFFAVLRCIPPTMEDMKVNQPWLFDDCTEHGEYFCFTTINHLVKMMNNLHEHRGLSVCKKTIFNQIKRLMDIGIITDKVNYIATGNRNPFSHEQDPKGRGRIQLWINSSILKLNASYMDSVEENNPSFFADLEKDLPLIEQSSLTINNKELKSIDNTSPTVDKAALPVGKLKTLSNQGKEQGNKSKTAKSPNFAPENLSKKDFQVRKIWDLFRFNLYDNYQFNEQTRIDSEEMIQQLLLMAGTHIEAYRKGRIKEFTANPAYLAAKNQAKSLKKFTSTLPSVERSSIEILSHAIVKQRKHAEKYNYLHELYYPVQYLSSPAALKALNYSIEDWSRIQENYFYKNKASRAYFEQVLWMNQKFSNTLEQLQSNGYQRTYSDLMTQYKKRVQELQQCPYLDEQQLKKLNNQFIHKFKPLFNDFINSKTNNNGKTSKN